MLNERLINIYIVRPRLDRVDKSLKLFPFPKKEDRCISVKEVLV